MPLENDAMPYEWIFQMRIEYAKDERENQGFYEEYLYPVFQNSQKGTFVIL